MSAPEPKSPAIAAIRLLSDIDEVNAVAQGLIEFLLSCEVTTHHGLMALAMALGRGIGTLEHLKGREAPMASVLAVMEAERMLYRNG